ESNSGSDLYAKAWLLRGINELQEGQKKKEENHFQKSKYHFEQALIALDKSFDLLYPKDKKSAAQAMKARIQAACNQNNHEAFSKALSLISELLNIYRMELFTKIDEPDEIYFMQGFAAAHLAEDEEEKTYFSIAEHSL